MTLSASKYRASIVKMVIGCAASAALCAMMFLGSQGCGADGSDCTVNVTRQCTCVNGHTGVQTCQADKTYTICNCSAADLASAAGGTSGTAGLTGAAGASGASGTTGYRGTCNTYNAVGCPCRDLPDCPIPSAQCVRVDNPLTGHFCANPCLVDTDCSYIGPGTGMCIRFATSGTATCTIRCVDVSYACPVGFFPYQISTLQGGVCICAPPP